MHRVLLFLLLSLQVLPLSAQRVPDSVFLDELTWVEVKEMIAAGKTTVIIATAGTEQKGPHMVLGEHKFALEYTTNRIARELGNALVAPIITYVPEGSWERPSGHMAMPGTITLPNDRFMLLLEHTAKSLRAGGFTDIILIGDSGGNQNGMRDVTAKLNEEWKDTPAKVHFIGDYYTKAQADQRRFLMDSLGVTNADIGSHAGMLDTSELMYINMNHIRGDKLALNGGFDGSGVSGDATKASAQLGEKLLRIKIDNALAQIRSSMGARAGVGAGAPVPAALAAAPATGAPYIEQMTWTEIRDAMAAGRKTIIIPTGGTEQNGPHMVLGKHNYIVSLAAKVMAERIGNTLVAPTVAWVPEGNYNSANFGARPGVISNPQASFEALLDAAARSLRVGGFTDIILIGDSGGNQSGLTNVANRLNEEWKGSGFRVYALTDYYNRGRIELRAWLLSQFGYDDATVGSHAGISDTSQLLYVFPDGIRRDLLAPGGGSPDSGVSGDPTKATAEIGRMAIDFKVNAGVAQYRALKAVPPA